MGEASGLYPARFCGRVEEAEGVPIKVAGPLNQHPIDSFKADKNEHLCH